MSRESVKEDIEFQINEIDNELNTFSKLIKDCSIRVPDLIETSALGSLLHAFYTGIEKILILVAKKIDKDMPVGKAWHKDLLMMMTKASQERERVISKEIQIILQEYLNFRHYFRYAYEHRLDWDKMRGMVLSINDVWVKIKNEILYFIKETQ